MGFSETEVFLAAMSYNVQPNLKLVILKRSVMRQQTDLPYTKVRGIFVPRPPRGHRRLSGVGCYRTATDRMR